MWTNWLCAMYWGDSCEQKDPCLALMEHIVQGSRRKAAGILLEGQVSLTSAWHHGAVLREMPKMALLSPVLTLGVEWALVWGQLIHMLASDLWVGREQHFPKQRQSWSAAEIWVSLSKDWTGESEIIRHWRMEPEAEKTHLYTRQQKLRGAKREPKLSIMRRHKIYEEWCPGQKTWEFIGKAGTIDAKADLGSLSHGRGSINSC